jgi:hypothetical protein
MIQNKLKKAIRYTLQMLISICIALEISLPPNPYKTHLIVLLTLYICLKHNIVERIIELECRAFKWIKEQFNIGTIR